MKKILMLTAAVFALQALPALAEEGVPKDGKHHRGDMFKEADKDGDGVISKEEFTANSQARAEKKFAEIDANKDGKVTKEEGQTHREAMKKKWEERKAAHEAGKKDVVPPAAE